MLQISITCYPLSNRNHSISLSLVFLPLHNQNHAQYTKTMNSHHSHIPNQKTRGKTHATCLIYIIPPSNPPQQTSTNEKKKNNKKTKKTVSSDNNSTRDKTHSRISSPLSFNHPLKTIYKEGKKSSARGPRFKRYGSKESKGVDICEDDGNKKKLIYSSGDYYSCHSFVVVKRSFDPYEDFKKSMCDMILEKQMFEPRELEHLLMSFLSLNSRMHHKVIIEAFSLRFSRKFSVAEITTKSLKVKIEE